MIFKYGNYTHAINEVALTIEKRALTSNAGQRIGLRSVWKLNGILHAADQQGVTTAVNQLTAAYDIDGQSAGLYLDDGVTATSHVLNNEEVLGGIRVSSIRFPTSEGAEYSTYRSYEITLEADFPDTQNDLIEFHETINFTGGGPKFIYLQTLSGLPQKQIIAQSTPFEVIQAGTAAARTGYPTVPVPLWPAAEHIDERVIVYKGPQSTDGLSQTFQVDWTYKFESSAAMSGLPTTI